MLASNQSSVKPFFVETTFVLFFLSLDFGQNMLALSIDVVFLGLTVLAVAVLPYYLPSAEGVDLLSWLTGRGAIAFFGILLGIMFAQVVGTLLPEIFRFAPLSLTIAAGAAACFQMFSSVLKPNFAD